MIQLRRQIFRSLQKWDKSPIRSPLLLVGPRQVGKTTALREFAKQIGQRVFEVNFWQDANQVLTHIFSRTGDPKKILSDLADYFEVAEIDMKNDVLLIDEIQECPNAYSSLKSFKEKFKDLRILVTGSYLQLFLKNEKLEKLPVGCVDELRLGPLSFSEFLNNADPILFEKYMKLSVSRFNISEPLHQKLFEKLNEYFFTGGLPEVVALYLSGAKNYEIRVRVRKKQKDLINQYTLDFQKYGKSSQVKKIDKLFQTIPMQLERVSDQSVDRFQFSQMGQGEKYSTLHWSFEFLENAGLIIRSYLVSKVDIPFRVHEQLEQRNIFKCFYFDMGLLGASLDLPLQISLQELGAYKGYLAENFVALSLRAQMNSGLVTYKKSSKVDSAEVEFLMASSGGGVIPIEVKSSIKSLASKSLDSFIRQYNPKLAYKLVPTTGVELKNKPYFALPLYMTEHIVGES